MCLDYNHLLTFEINLPQSISPRLKVHFPMFKSQNFSPTSPSPFFYPQIKAHSLACLFCSTIDSYVRGNLLGENRIWVKPLFVQIISTFFVLRNRCRCKTRFALNIIIFVDKIIQNSVQQHINRVILRKNIDFIN